MPENILHKFGKDPIKTTTVREQWLKYKFGGPGTLKKFGALL